MNDGFSERFLFGLVAGDDVTLSVHEKLLEIPFDLPGECRVFGEISVERMCLIPQDCNLAE